MYRISHRINKIEQLKSLPLKYGAEVDIRSNGGKLILHHDPFTNGDKFEEWIKFYKHNMLILNVKEDGLEDRLISIMEQYNIKNYFFLDQSFPSLIKLVEGGEKRCSVRVSEFEAIDTALFLTGKVEWIWVDCFKKMPLTRENANTLKGAGFKLCFVSPELHLKVDKKYVQNFKNNIMTQGITVDAVCTKYLDVWE